MSKDELRDMTIVIADPYRQDYRMIREWIVDLYDEGIIFIPKKA